MSNLEKLNKILSNNKSSWEEEAKWREENETWLSFSFDIAILVLDTLKAKRMTQKDLAEKMGVSPQFINKVVKGQENLSLETIGKLGSALGLKLIDVASTQATQEITYDYEQAYHVSVLYSRENFRQLPGNSYLWVVGVQEYDKERRLEYKMQH